MRLKRSATRAGSVRSVGWNGDAVATRGAVGLVKRLDPTTETTIVHPSSASANARPARSRSVPRRERDLPFVLRASWHRV
jgi:hypothetical protein